MALAPSFVGMNIMRFGISCLLVFLAARVFAHAGDEIYPYTVRVVTFEKGENGNLGTEFASDPPAPNGKPGGAGGPGPGGSGGVELLHDGVLNPLGVVGG